MIVVANYGFDFVAPRGEKPFVFGGIRGAGDDLRFQMLGIPDRIIHTAAIKIDQRYFLGRVDLRQCSNARAQIKAEVFMRRPMNVAIKKRGMLTIVNRGQDVSVNIVDSFTFKKRLREAFGNFVAVAYSFFPVTKSLG